jgi:hypothetical protein
MNLVGKIFTLLIMVMSIVFTSFSVMVYATHKNWRNEALAQKRNMDEANKKIEQLNDELDNRKQEYEASVELLTKKATTALTELNNRLADVNRLTDLNTKEAARAAEAASAMGSIAESLKQRRDEIGIMQADLLHTKQVQGQHFDTNVKLTAEKSQALFEVDRLNGFVRDQADKIVDLQGILAYHGMSEHKPLNYQTPPRVEGVILAMSDGGDLITISIGSDDGILKDHQLEVFRLGSTPKYLGRVQVIETHPDRAVAKVIPETRKGPFEKYDHVATKLR